MYSRIVSKVSAEIAKKIKHQSLLIIQNRRFCYGGQSFTDNKLDEIPKDCVAKLNWIDERAQAEVDKMIANDPNIARLKKVVELEYEVMKQEGDPVPSILRPRDWEEILQISSRNKRKKFLQYLFLNEKRKEKVEKEKLEYQMTLEQIREENNSQEHVEGGIIYDFGHNFMIRNLCEMAMNRLWNWNALRASMFGNKLVFDFGYEQFMNSNELKTCAKQLIESFDVNRMHDQPFEFIFCNVDFNGPLIDRMIRYIPSLLDNDFPINIKTESYLDLFDQSKLIYLSPHAPKDLETYNPDFVYILGAYVDKGPVKPISFAKAKKEKIQMARFPIDLITHFSSGFGKNLSLNVCTSIMLDRQIYNWNVALRHMPKRKTFFENRLQMMERKIQEELFLKKTNSADPNFDPEDVITPKYDTEELCDFRHSARAKLRRNWDK